MFCTQCGLLNSPDARFCLGCGASAPGEGPPGAAPIPGSTNGAPPVYSGFWLRFAAATIDGVLVWIASMIVVLPLSLLFALAFVAGAGAQQERAGSAAFEIGNVIGMLTSLLIGWLYEALQLSSGRQATLGKLALGLIVTDVAGGRLSFGRASARFFSKYLSLLSMMIGYLIQPFTAKRQALHDLVAGTLVVRKPPRS